MERLTAAVKRAMTIPESEEDITLDDTKSSENRAIHISLNGTEQYTLPWNACRTWPVRGPLIEQIILTATNPSSAWRLSSENGFAKIK